MKWNFGFASIVFLAGLASGSFVQGGMNILQQKDSHASDLAAIEKLHHEDIEVTLSQDERGLADIWTDDAVRFNPPELPAVGKKAIQAENEKFHARNPDFKVLSYTPQFADIQIIDGLACEGVESEAKFKMSPNAQPTIWQGRGFRVLKRQSDGSWKFAVLIVNQ